MGLIRPVLLSATLCAAVAGTAGRQVDHELRRPAALKTISLPLSFEENRGQTDGSVRFVAHTTGGTLFLAEDETVLRLRDGVLRTRLVGANASPAVVGEGSLPGRANYFLGNEPSKWRTGVPTFGSVRHRGVYPGIDLVHHGRDGRVEYDFVLAPGADAGAIEMAFDGADSVEVDRAGDLVVRVGAATVRHEKPVVFQDGEHGRTPVEGAFVALGDGHVRFEISPHDESRALCIDPTIVFATYLGGNGQDGGRALTRDTDGNLYVCGSTYSSDFPVASAYQPAARGGGDAFVTKLDPTASTLLYSTYLGGSGIDGAQSIHVDDVSRSVYLAGGTQSSDFPVTPGTVQQTFGGYDDAFVVKLGATGSTLTFATYLGGPGVDDAEGMAVDAAGDVFLTGVATENFPTTPGAYQTSTGDNDDAFCAKLNPTATTLLYSTRIGGSGNDVGHAVAIDAGGDAYVTGLTISYDFPGVNAYQSVFGGFTDGFLTRVNSTGTGVVFSTLIGGNGDDQCMRVVLMGSPNPNVFVCGATDSTDLATVAPLQSVNAGSIDVLFAEFTSAGVALHVSYLGGSSSDAGLALAADASGRIWIAGSTYSANFPVVSAPQARNAGATDAFIARFADTFTSLEYSTYAGGPLDDGASDMVVDSAGTPIILGSTTSGYPTTEGAFQVAAPPGFNTFIATPPAPSPVPIKSFLVPVRIAAKVNAHAAARSSVVATGVVDTGPDFSNLAGAATLDVGGLHYDMQGVTPNGRTFVYSANGASLAITPSKTGSSHATFTMKCRGDLTGNVAVDGLLALRFQRGTTDARASVKLTHGAYTIGNVRGALVAPNLYLAAATATLRGPGRDALSIGVGLANDGTTPSSPSDVTIGFGGNPPVTVAANNFTRRGDRYVSSGDAGGITKVIIDYARGTMAIVGVGLDLGAFAPGGNSVLVSIRVGADARAVRVRMVRKGETMKY